MGAAKRLAEGVGTVWVKPEDGGVEMVSFTEGDEIPDWAAKQMGDHCFDASDKPEKPKKNKDKSGKDDSKGSSSTDPGNGTDGAEPGYSKLLKADLEAEVAKRNDARDDADKIEVGGNGTVKDLVAALEADDAANDG